MAEHLEEQGGRVQTLHSDSNSQWFYFNSLFVAFGSQNVEALRRNPLLFAGEPGGPSCAKSQVCSHLEGTWHLKTQAQRVKCPPGPLMQNEEEKRKLDMKKPPERRWRLRSSSLMLLLKNNC